jgi:hypothetical protein
MRKLLFPLALSAALMPSAHAASLDLSLNDEMAQFLVTSPTETWGMQDAEVGFGLLFNEDDDLIGTLRLLSTNRVSPSLRFGVGVQGYLGDLDGPNETPSAIAIGGNVAVSLAAQVPIALVLEGWLAPNILAFGDAERITDVSARVEAEVSNRAAVFIGYRLLEVDIENAGNDYEIVDGGVLGVRFGF